MKLLSNKIKIEIQDDLKLLWEIKGCIFTYSPIDFNYNLIQLEDSNFFIISEIGDASFVEASFFMPFCLQSSTK